MADLAAAMPCGAHDEHDPRFRHCACKERVATPWLQPRVRAQIGALAAAPFLLVAVAVAAVPGVSVAGGGAAAAGPASTWQTAVVAVTAVLVALLAVGTIRNTATARARAAQLTASSKASEFYEAWKSDSAYIAAKLSAAIGFRTVSYTAWDTDKADPAQMRGLHGFLQEQYPGVHAALERRVVNELSLIYVWRAGTGAGKAKGKATGKGKGTGTGTGGGKRPIALCAHMDVVPTPNEARWEVEPFSGKVEGGFVWGRGSIDDKQAVLGTLEACERLLASGFVPDRDIYLLFGHDEEIGGEEGARHIAATLLEEGVQFEFILDEGLFVMKGVQPGHAAPVAAICGTEKGSVTIELTVEGEPGHSSRGSTPASPLRVLAAAVSRVEQSLMPPHFGPGPERAQLEAMAAGHILPLRVLMSNLWLFGPLLRRILASHPITHVLVRTTTAVTVFNAGKNVNVIPGEARAIVNHRIHPGDRVADVVAHDRRAIGDDRVKMRVLHEHEAAPVSDTDSEGFRTIARCARGVFQDCTPVPSLMVGNTDTRWYWKLSDDIYRFCPTMMLKSDLARFHGLNERIGVDNLVKICAFYGGLIADCASP